MSRHTIKRRDFLKTMGVGAAALTISGGIGACGTIKNRPNIIIFYTDDQGTLDVNSYGSKDLYTPHMDALAERGVRFTQAYAHAVCCPSRVSLLTGRHPQRGDINRWASSHPDINHPFGKGANMSLEEVTIAEVLKENGYRTALFGKWHLGATPGYGPNEQGFDEFFGHLSGFIDNYSHTRYVYDDEQEQGAEIIEPFHSLYRNNTEVFEDGNYFPDLIVRESNRFLEENKDRPFFMYVPFNVPHYPEQADPKFTEMYKEISLPRSSYAAMISTTDDRIGQILNKVDQLDLRDNTMIILMSDNGHSTEDYHKSDGQPYGAYGGGGNTGKWRGAKGSFLEGGIRVPAVISFPKLIGEGQVRDQAVLNADFFPTILELCDIPLPDRKIDGKSMWPVLNSPEAPSRHKVFYWQWGRGWAVREGAWKLIVNGGDSTGKYSPHPQRKGPMESPFLANLSDDPPEWNNFAAERPEIVERLTTLYNEWASDVMKR